LPISSWLDWKFRLADKIVLQKIRSQVLGGRVDYLGSGGSALNMKVSLSFSLSPSPSQSPKVLEFFEDVGIPIVEGYGLTETSPIVTCSTPGSWQYRRLGCVGSPLPGVKLLIVDPLTMVWCQLCPLSPSLLSHRLIE
jgi:long-chain acyl-CoA synthetase